MLVVIKIFIKKKKITTTDDNKIKAGKSGAIDVILSTLKTHITNPDVCSNGCGALWNITYNGKPYHI